MVGPEISRRLPIFDNFRITYYQGLGVFIFAVFSVSYTVAKRLPPSISHLPRHILVSLLGLYPGRKADEIVERDRNMRVLIIEDYISKHPEDFPLANPKKYKDILQPWVPVR